MEGVYLVSRVKDKQYGDTTTGTLPEENTMSDELRNTIAQYQESAEEKRRRVRELHNEIERLNEEILELNIQARLLRFKSNSRYNRPIND